MYIDKNSNPLSGLRQSRIHSVQSLLTYTLVFVIILITLVGCNTTKKGTSSEDMNSASSSDSVGKSESSTDSEKEPDQFAGSKPPADYLAENKTDTELETLDDSNLFTPEAIQFDGTRISIPSEYDITKIDGSRWYRGEVVGLTDQNIVLAQLKTGPDFGADRYDVNRVVAKEFMAGTDTVIAELKLGDYIDIFYDGMLITGAKNFGPISSCIVYIEVNEVTKDASGELIVKGNDGTVEVTVPANTEIWESIQTTGEYKIPADVQELLNKSFMIRIEHSKLHGNCLRGRVREIWR